MLSFEGAGNILYALAFFEGIIKFVSPCVLPMLPLYLSYFMGEGDSANREDRRRALLNLAGFILGFTTIFVMLGALAGMMGGLLTAHQTTLNTVTGIFVILIGMFYLGVIRIRSISINAVDKGMASLSARAGFGGGDIRLSGFLSSVVFGLVFGLAWTPCIGPVLAALLAISANQGSAGSGVVLLLFYSAGIAVPFILSTLFLEQLKGAFDFVKRNFTTFRKVSGSVLVVVGILMITGHMHQILLFTSSL